VLRRVSAGAYRTRTQASQTRAPFGLHSVQTLHSHVALVGASLVSAFSVLAGPPQDTSESGTSARAAIGPVCVLLTSYGSCSCSVPVRFFDLCRLEDSHTAVAAILAAAKQPPVFAAATVHTPSALPPVLAPRRGCCDRTPCSGAHRCCSIPLQVWLCRARGSSSIASLRAALVTYREMLTRCQQPR
jgi:hypothetical protein